MTDDPTWFDGVRAIGVDEHVRRHTHRGDRYVTVIIDLPPVRDGTGPARLLDMEGRSKPVLKGWLDARPAEWKDKIEAVAMDGFTGFKTATVEEVPDATAVTDPFQSRWSTYTIMRSGFGRTPSPARTAISPHPRSR